MGAMCTGNLFYDAEARRYNIRFDLERYYGGLHCGECMDVMIQGNWKATRIEMNSEGYYLVGVPGKIDGLQVRI
jgi:hypothetical protein